jgi:alpha,alpha-trehalose phosphorylase
MNHHLFGIDAWVLREESFDRDTIAAKETLFALGNGYLGIRGCHEELDASWWRGSYVNGFYESRPIVYGERAYGFADRYQTILNCSDATLFTLNLHEESFSPASSHIDTYSRELDLRTGILKRNLVWSPSSVPGTKVKIESRRLVPYQPRHLMLISYRVTLIEGGGDFSLRHELSGDVSNLAAGDDPRTGSHIMPGDFGIESVRQEENRTVLNHFTKMSGLRMCVVADRSLSCSAGETGYELWRKERNSSGIVGAQANMKAGDWLEMVVCAGWYHGAAGEEQQLESKAISHVSEALSCGFDAAADKQKELLDHFWEDADLLVEHAPEVQQSIRFNLFHLLQGAGREGGTSLPAKGLTGEGYEGHFFWDTEIYALPFFLYTRPEIARDLLEYRYRILPHARGRAAQLGYPGALYPWRTINGNEASAFFPAGTAQYHINADIAYAVVKYLDVSGDGSFLAHGVEILLETARFWYGFGDFIPSRGGAFCINCVTGPDEYTALVDNNYYTNLMARENLRSAVRFLDLLKKRQPEAWKGLVDSSGLDPGEPEAWLTAADAMYLPYNEELGVTPQDDTFLSKARWERASIPSERRPLLLHYHPLTIYRYQILKQADLVLAQMLLGRYFSHAQKKRDFDYYDPLTTADSSLSPCIQGVMAARLGYAEESYRHFTRSVRMDLDDVNGNVRDGIHAAAMAGSWISLVYGFAGLEDYDGMLRFAPALPAAWSRLSFSLRKGHSALEVSIGHEEVSYRIKRGEALTIFHEGRRHKIFPGAPLVISMRPELEAVIFDLDGVITDSAEYHYLAWKQLCDELEIPFDRQFNNNLKGVGRMASLELLLARGTHSYSPEEKASFAARKNEYYKKLIARITPDDLLPGIDALLSALHEAGIRTALASASRNASAILGYLGISDRFDVVTDPGALKKGKPDPEQFFLAAELLGVPYRNCIGVEDAQAGIDAINAAGMLSVGIGGYLEGAALCLSSTAELSLERLREAFFRR